jgi:hypothetical protein
MRTVTGLACLALVVVSCGDGDAIEVADAWGRPNPAVAEAAALYVTLVNHGDTDDALVGARSDRCADAQLHETVMDGDVATMQHVMSTALPAGDTVAMAPGGLHVMCMGVTSPLEPGETISVTLEFAASADVEVAVPVEDR